MGRLGDGAIGLGDGGCGRLGDPYTKNYNLSVYAEHV